MAKNKRATALFEVMSKAKQAGKTGIGGGIPTPKWWFRSTNRSEVRTLAPDKSASSAEHDDTDDSTQTPVETSRLSVTPLMSSSFEAGEGSSLTPQPRVQPIAVAMDSIRQQINLRLSYTSALIGGFGIFVVIGIAILIGKSMSRGPSPAVADTDTKTIQKGPVTPGVMNIRKTDGANVGGNDAVEGGARPTGNSTGTRNPQQPQNGFNDPRPPSTFFTDDPRRQNGLNYIIVQSYPDRETATKAAQFLTTNGVPCTVEKDLPNWGLPWKDGCVVVGIRGFSKVKDNPPLEQYKKSIMDLSVKFSAGRSKFLAFAPSAYKWQKGN